MVIQLNSAVLTQPDHHLLNKDSTGRTHSMTEDESLSYNFQNLRNLVPASIWITEKFIGVV